MALKTLIVVEQEDQLLIKMNAVEM